jgi:outer membrane protein W
MKTLTQTLAIAAIAVSATAAQAQLYGEIGYSALKISGPAPIGKIEASPKMLGLTVGYGVLNNVAVEAMLGLNAGDDAAKADGEATNGKMKIERAFGLFVKPRAMLGANVEVFGRFGYARTTANTTTPDASNSADSNGFAYGLGANYYFNAKTYLSVNYMKLSNKDEGKIDGFTFGLGMKF